MADLGRFVLRQSTDVDCDAVCEFYVNHWHGFNAYRRIDKLVETIKQRRLFLVECATTHEVVGAAAVFDHLDGMYQQAGASRIPVMGGFGLHHLLHRARAVHAHLTGTRSLEYFAAIEDGNAQSIQNALCIGFDDWPEPPPPLRYQAITKKDIKLHFFRLHTNRVYEFAQWFMNEGDVVELHRTHRRTGEDEHIAVHLRTEAMIYYPHLVHDLAKQHDPAADTGNYTI